MWKKANDHTYVKMKATTACLVKGGQEKYRKKRFKRKKKKKGDAYIHLYIYIIEDMKEKVL